MSGTCKTNTVSSDCILRHEQQEKMIDDVKEMRDALVGTATHQEDSLVSKVNVLVNDMMIRNKIMMWFWSIFAIAIIGAIFSAGVLYNRINNIEQRVLENSSDISMILKTLK